MEPLSSFVSLYDFGLNRWKRHLLTVAEFSSLISAISKQFFEERVSAKQGFQNENATIPILNIRWMNKRVKQEPYSVDKDMPFLALDFLSCIEA